MIKVSHLDILYAQSIKDYILLHTTIGRYIVHMTMKSLVEILPENEFVRIHRSYLVSKGKIGIMGKSQIQIGEQAIPVGKRYKANLESIS